MPEYAGLGGTLHSELEEESMNLPCRQYGAASLVHASLPKHVVLNLVKVVLWFQVHPLTWRRKHVS